MGATRRQTPSCTPSTATSTWACLSSDWRRSTTSTSTPFRTGFNASSPTTTTSDDLQSGMVNLQQSSESGSWSYTRGTSIAFTYLIQYAVLAHVATNTFVPQRCGLSLLN
ncbi:hypothetical protein ON010_g14786 [Phytophthora cinnamomi]|nr:hypothetical protein ON010_g14786 [Phytophthora cinnamomi]